MIHSSADLQDREWRIAVGDAETTAIYEPAENARAVFVCAHGAGGHMRDRGMESLSRELRRPFVLSSSKDERAALSTVRFNFLYRGQGSHRPDPMPLLKKCMTAVVEHTRKELQPRMLIIGGRSMGGRTASMLAADGLDSDGLLLFAYPLHPAGKPEKLRDAHLPRIRVPVLCFNGTRDALCTRELMEGVVASFDANWTMHWLEGADHSFHVLKSSGRTDQQVMDEVSTATAQWADELVRRRA